MRMRAMVSGSASVVVAFAFSLPASAQSTGPRHDGYDPNAALAGHYHEGELGEKLMILESGFKCECGCGLDVHTCQFQMQCGTSPGWSRRIQESLAAGESVDVIKAGFVADFGTQVLMLPPPEGFNLVGYLLPAVAIVTAGMLVGLVIRGGKSREALAPVAELSDDDAERLRAALQNLDESESPDW